MYTEWTLHTKGNKPKKTKTNITKNQPMKQYKNKQTKQRTKENNKPKKTNPDQPKNSSPLAPKTHPMGFTARLWSPKKASSNIQVVQEGGLYKLHS